MTPTLRAILGRFNWNRTLAADYCERIAYTYAHLRVEYRYYRDIIVCEGRDIIIVGGK